MLRIGLSLCPLVLVSLACSTVTVRDKGNQALSAKATYESSEPYFFWRLVGEPHIDVRQVCEGKEATQVQATDTFLDGVLGLVTLGIYMPRTAKVWCRI